MDYIALSLAIIALVFSLFGWVGMLLKYRERPGHLPSVSRPLVLSVTPGAPKHGPYTIPSLGEYAITQYHVRDYDKPLHCCTCGREFVEDENFWSIAIPDYSDALLGVCVLCYGKAIA